MAASPIARRSSSVKAVLVIVRLRLMAFQRSSASSAVLRRRSACSRETGALRDPTE